MSEKHTIKVTVNGTTYQKTVEPRLLLSDFIRQELSLTGTHVGCEHGVCGACTVHLDGTPVRSCLMLAVQCDERTVTTVEGLAEQNGGELTPLQESFRECHALQCGFCTPGMLMTLEDLLKREPDADEEKIRTEIAGNLCRCTGYQHIVEAALKAKASCCQKEEKQ